VLKRPSVIYSREDYTPPEGLRFILQIMPKPTLPTANRKEEDDVAEEIIVDTSNMPPKERPYRDYSQEVEPLLSRHGVETTTGSGTLAVPNLANLTNLASGEAPSSSSNNTGHGFPVKLYDALLALEAAGMSHIACFLPHGRAFRVLQPQTFVTSVLSTYEIKTENVFHVEVRCAPTNHSIFLSLALADGLTNPSLLRFNAN
jgi:hypothetical protein